MASIDGKSCTVVAGDRRLVRVWGPYYRAMLLALGHRPDEVTVTGLPSVPAVGAPAAAGDVLAAVTSAPGSISALVADTGGRSVGGVLDAVGGAIWARA